MALVKHLHSTSGRATGSVELGSLAPLRSPIPNRVSRYYERRVEMALENVFSSTCDVDINRGPHSVTKNVYMLHKGATNNYGTFSNVALIAPLKRLNFFVE